MMCQVNMHEAKTHLSHLVDEAAEENSFVICKAGKPMVRVTPLAGEQTSPPPRRRLGLLLGECSVPVDFDRIDADAIAGLFEGV